MFEPEPWCDSAQTLLVREPKFDARDLRDDRCRPVTGDHGTIMNTLRLQMRFLVPLVFTLVAAAYLALPLMDRLTLRWYTRDLVLRGSLVANALSDSVAEALAHPEAPQLSLIHI